MKIKKYNRWTNSYEAVLEKLQKNRTHTKLTKMFELYDNYELLVFEVAIFAYNPKKKVFHFFVLLHWSPRGVYKTPELRCYS